MLLLPLPAADPGPEHGLPHDQGGAGVGRGGGRYGASSPGEEEDDNYNDVYQIPAKPDLICKRVYKRVVEQPEETPAPPAEEQ